MMRVRPLLCSTLLLLSGCAGADTMVSWGATPQGDPFVDVTEVQQHEGNAIPRVQLTLVAGDGVQGLRVHPEPDAWLVTWSPQGTALQPSPAPFYVRAERLDQSWPGSLCLRALEPGTGTDRLFAPGGSEGWPWRVGAIYPGSVGLRLEADGRFLVLPPGPREDVDQAR
jgi:hypothetical protein